MVDPKGGDVKGEGECVEELNIYRGVARISKKGGETAIILGFCNPMISDTTDLWQLLLILTVCELCFAPHRFLIELNEMLFP